MSLYYRIANNILMRGLVNVINKTIVYFKRIIGLLRFKALVKNSGKGSFYSLYVEIKYGNNIIIGDNVTVGPYTCFGAKSSITIGSNVRISRGVILETAGLDMTKPPPYKHSSKPIVICDGVWIASNAIILGGVTIGENSIIGANTVVTKDVEANSIIVGQSPRILQKKVVR